MYGIKAYYLVLPQMHTGIMLFPRDGDVPVFAVSFFFRFRESMYSHE